MHAPFVSLEQEIAVAGGRGSQSHGYGGGKVPSNVHFYSEIQGTEGFSTPSANFARATY